MLTFFGLFCCLAASPTIAYPQFPSFRGPASFRPRNTTVTFHLFASNDHACFTDPIQTCEAEVAECCSPPENAPGGGYFSAIGSVGVDKVAKGRIVYRTAGIKLDDDTPFRCATEEEALHGPVSGYKCLRANTSLPTGQSRPEGVDPKLGGAIWNEDLSTAFHKRDGTPKPEPKCNKKARPVLYGYESRAGMKLTWALRFPDDETWAKFQDTHPLDDVRVLRDTVWSGFIDMAQDGEYLARMKLFGAKAFPSFAAAHAQTIESEQATFTNLQWPVFSRLRRKLRV